MTGMDSLPLEIVTRILNSLERCELDNDFNSCTWPVHSKACIADVRNARLSCQKLYNASWPVFGRIIGSTAFTLTPGVMILLEQIATREELQPWIETLTFSNASYVKNSREDSIRGLKFVQLLFDFRRRSGQPLDKDYQARMNDLAQAVTHCRQAELMFWYGRGSSQGDRMLAGIFKVLKNLRNLRMMNHQDSESQVRGRLWPFMELEKKCVMLDSRLSARYAVYTSRIGHGNTLLPTAIRHAIRDSGCRQLRSIVHERGVVERLGHVHSMHWLKSLVTVHGLDNVTTLKWSLVQRNITPHSASKVLAYIINGVKNLQHLYFCAGGAIVMGLAASFTTAPKLRLLELSDILMDPVSFVGMIGPKLEKLRLRLVAVGNHPQGSMGIRHKLFDARAWSSLLHQIVGKARLVHLELEDLGPSFFDGLNIDIPTDTIKALSKRVRLLVVRRSMVATRAAQRPLMYARGEGEEKFEENVYLHGVRIGDGSQQGIWLAGGRFGFPLDVQANTESGKLVDIF